MAGKFGSEADAMVYELTLDGICGMLGDVQGPGHYCRLELDGETAEAVAAEYGLDTAPRWAIVEEDSQGFVTVHYFDTEAGYSLVWAGIVQDVATFYADQEADDPGGYLAMEDEASV